MAGRVYEVLLWRLRLLVNNQRVVVLGLQAFMSDDRLLCRIASRGPSSELRSCRPYSCRSNRDLLEIVRATKNKSIESDDAGDTVSR